MGAEQVREPDRWLKARLDLIVASLPLAVLLNPIWSLLFAIPFGGLMTGQVAGHDRSLLVGHTSGGEL